MPVANSRFSRPRAISPSASDGTLPCSAVRCAASSWRRWSTRFRILNMMSVRLDSDVARQAGKAALAAATAAATSSVEAKSTWRVSAPGRRVVDGALATGCARHELPVDPVADPAGWRRRGDLGFGDLGHDGILVRRCRGPATRARAVPLTILRRRDRPRSRPGLRTAAGSPGSGHDGPSSPSRAAPARRPALPQRHRTSDDRRPDHDPDRDHAADRERTQHRRIPPRDRDHGPDGRPGAQHDQQQAAVACVATSRRRRRRPGPAPGSGSRTPRTAAPDATAAPGASEPHGPGPRYAVAQAASSGDPWPLPPSAIASLPPPSATSSGRASVCAHRPTGAPSSLPTYAAGQHPTDDRQPELQPADRRIEQAERSRGEASGTIASWPRRPPITAPGTAPTAMYRRSSARSEARRARSPGDDQTGGEDGGERDRLPSHDEAVAQAQEGVEVERDDGDRHGPASVPVRRRVGWPTRHVSPVPSRAMHAARHHPAHTAGRARAQPAVMGGTRSASLGAVPIGVPASGLPGGWAGRRDRREGTPCHTAPSRRRGLEITLLGRFADPDHAWARSPHRRPPRAGALHAPRPDASAADTRGDRDRPLAGIDDHGDRAPAPGAVPAARRPGRGRAGPRRDARGRRRDPGVPARRHPQLDTDRFDACIADAACGAETAVALYGGDLAEGLGHDCFAAERERLADRYEDALADGGRPAAGGGRRRWCPRGGRAADRPRPAARGGARGPHRRARPDRSRARRSSASTAAWRTCWPASWLSARCPRPTRPIGSRWRGPSSGRSSGRTPWSDPRATASPPSADRGPSTEARSRDARSIRAVLRTFLTIGRRDRRGRRLYRE